MKKIFLMLLVIGIVFSCCSCGVNSIEEACDKADKMLVEFSKKGEAWCSYEGEYEKIDGVYYYCVEACADSSVSEEELYIDALMVNVAEKIHKNVYPDLQKVFNKFDVDVIIVVCEYDGTSHKIIMNDEVNDLS